MPADPKPGESSPDKCPGCGCRAIESGRFHISNRIAAALEKLVERAEALYGKDGGK